MTLLVPKASKSQNYDASQWLSRFMNQNAPATFKFWIDMDPKLIGLLWTFDAKVILLVPEASKYQI